MRIGVFIERGKRGWKFRAYSTWFNETWKGCNVVEVPDDVPRSEAKAKAIAMVKARMDLNSKILPSGLNCC